MDWKQRRNGLELHDELVCNDKVSAVTAFNGFASIRHWKRHLLLKGNACQLQLSCQTLPVRDFKKSWTQLLVDPDRTADDPP